MYNRYIPQNDGTYCRRSIPERPREPFKSMPPEKQPVPPPTTPASPAAPCRNDPSPPAPHPRHTHYRRERDIGISNFWKQLLPKDFGTEDLLIVLLLLLMAGDCPEDQNTALLTLALYLFL